MERTATDCDKRPVKPRAYPEDRVRYIPDKPATRMAAAPRALKIFKKDVEKYSPTPGCRACTEVITGRDEIRHTITQNIPHNNDCRARMTELMRNDDIDKARVDLKLSMNAALADGETIADAGNVATDDIVIFSPEACGAASPASLGQETSSWI